MTDMTRLDALRALLAAHEPCADDQRAGHTYVFTTPAESVKMKPRVRRAKRLAAKLLPMVGWRTA